MKKLVIFGLGDMAILAHYYFSGDPDYQVCAFSVTKEFINDQKKTMFNLPIVPFEDINALYPPDQYVMFIAVGYKNLNKERANLYNAAKQMGYNLATYIHPKATVLTPIIGDNCFIFEDNTIQPFVEIGNNVILWSGNHIGHHTIIDDHCFITSHVVLAGRTYLGKYSFVGVNATIIDDVKVAENCIIGAGSLITKDTNPGTVYKMKAAELSAVPSDKVQL